MIKITNLESLKFQNLKVFIDCSPLLDRLIRKPSSLFHVVSSKLKTSKFTVLAPSPSREISNSQLSSLTPPWAQVGNLKLANLQLMRECFSPVPCLKTIKAQRTPSASVSRQSWPFWPPCFPWGCVPWVIKFLSNSLCSVMSLHIWTKIRRRESQSASEGGPEIVYKTNKNPNPIYSFFRKNITAKKTGKLWSANFLSKGNVYEKPNYNKKDAWWEWNQHKGNCLDDFDYSILKTPLD